MGCVAAARLKVAWEACSAVRQGWEPRLQGCMRCSPWPDGRRASQHLERRSFCSGADGPADQRGQRRRR